jgi:hypothetical protein
MHGDYRFCFSGGELFERVFHGGGIDVESAGGYVNKNGIGPQVAGNLGGGGEGAGGNQHGIAGAYPTGLQRQVQAAGCRVDGKTAQAGGLQEFGKFFFKGKGLGAGGQPTGTKHPQHGLFFLLADKRPGKGDVA